MVGRVERPSWDPNKERENRARHGVGFDEAESAMEDPLWRTWLDHEHSGTEACFIAIGESTLRRLLVVVVTVNTEGKMRIISARRATKRERHAYEDF